MGTPAINKLNNVVMPLILYPIESTIERMVKASANDAIKEAFDKLTSNQTAALDESIGKGGYWTCKAATGIKSVVNGIKSWFGL